MQDVHWGVSSFKWLETRYGRILSLSSEGHNDQYERLAYQPYIVTLLETDKYDLFIDCGAEIGLFSFVGAHHCKRVISFEASPFLYGILLFNLRHKFNVECKYGWVGKEEQIPKAKEESLQMVTGRRSFKYNISVVELDNEIISLDDFPSYKKILIKIDIEGNELIALEKATELLKMSNVYWVIDCHVKYGFTLEDVCSFFKNRKIYSAGSTLVIKGDKSEANDPMFKGWKVIE